MASLFDYVNLDLYNTCADGDDFVQGKNLELWLTPLENNENIPPFKEVTLVNNCVIGQESIDISVGENFTIYSGDIFYIPDIPSIILITQTKALTVGVNTLQVAPLINNFNSGLILNTLALKPLKSAVDGGSFSSNKSSALARTKISILTPHRSSNEQDGSISVSGLGNVNDPGLHLIEKYPNKRYFVETRYNVYINFTQYLDFNYRFGAGVNAVYGQFILEPFNLQVVRSDFIKYDLTFTQNGCMNRYLDLLPPTLDPNAVRYCPLSDIRRNPIDYTPITPTPVTIGYCPLDNSVRNPVPFAP